MTNEAVKIIIFTFDTTAPPKEQKKKFLIWTHFWKYPICLLQTLADSRKSMLIGYDAKLVSKSDKRTDDIVVDFSRVKWNRYLKEWLF